MKLVLFPGYAFIIAGLAVLGGGAWADGPAGSMSDHPPSHSDAHGHASGSGAASAHGPARHPKVHVTLRSEPDAPMPGQPSRLSFRLSDASGKAVEQLIPHHGRKLHVVIVDEAMEVLGHVHPEDFDEPVSGGMATVSYTFPRAGRYLVAADFMTADGPQAAQFTLDVADSANHTHGARSAMPAPSIRHVTLEAGDRYTRPILLPEEPDASAEYGVALQAPPQIRAGEETTLTYRFTRNGSPLADLRPYLDAAMHLAVVRDDLGHFLHEHGTVSGADHTSRHAHSSPGHPVAGAFGPEVTVSLSFPAPGTYHLFGQAAHGDTLIVSRHPVLVR